MPRGMAWAVACVLGATQLAALLALAYLLLSLLRNVL